MHSYLHNVSGFYLRRDLAEITLAQLLRLGLRSRQLQIIAADSSSATALPQWSRHALLKNLLTCSVAGAASGIAFGVLLEVALLLGDTSPLGTWLLHSPAMLLGWCALGGALLGAALGTARLWKPARGKVDSDVLLVAQTHSARETAIVHEAMKASADLCKDTDMRAESRG